MGRIPAYSSAATPVPIETAIILAAAFSNFGGLFPLAVLFALAIAGRIGLAAARPDAFDRDDLRAVAAVCLALGVRDIWTGPGGRGFAEPG